MTQPNQTKARYAYADPPYLGCCGMYGHRHEGGPWSLWTQMGMEPDAKHNCWDEPLRHRDLIDYLKREFPDGWALSSSVPAYRKFEREHWIPAEARIGVWYKSFSSFKPNVNPAYCWEPVVVCGGRQDRDRAEVTVRDVFVSPITLKKGLTGVKPLQFNQWILDLLGYQDGDELVDLFPGKGGMAVALAQGRLAV